MYVIDVESRLAAASWDFSLGPTRHAYFNVRLAESIAVANGGRVRDDRGRSGGEAVSGSEARWVDFSGPVGGGHVAGIAVFPDPRDHDDLSWFVADWGVVTVGPFRINGRVVRQGEVAHRALSRAGPRRRCRRGRCCRTLRGLYRVAVALRRQPCRMASSPELA